MVNGLPESNDTLLIMNFTLAGKAAQTGYKGPLSWARFTLMSEADMLSHQSDTTGDTYC